MNIKKYAHEYSKFHNSFTFDLVEDLIILPFSVWKWDDSKVLRLKNFDKIKSNNTTPLVQAMKVYLKTDAICSVFLSKDTYSILVGNQTFIIPEYRGSLKLCATPYFVKDTKIFEKYSTPLPNVFIYKDAILFLDELDVPSPGGNYFNNNTARSEYYRVCFLTSVDPLPIWNDLKSWKMTTIPFYSKSAEILLSPFIKRETVSDINFPDSFIKSTAIIDKKHPHNLILDILKTYMRNGGLIDNLGLFIEYPIRVTFEGSCQATNNGLKQFLCLSINGNEPKKVLHIQCPYDRYTEYTHIPAVPWTRILFDPSNVPLGLRRVVIGSMMLGYVYQDAFFCLSYPMLEIKPGNLNTEYLLNVFSTETTEDDQITLIDSYRYDCTHDIHRVKHRDLPHDLWCLTPTTISEPNTYSKKLHTPEFVRHWLSFYDSNKGSKENCYGNLDVVKLALVLARHRICYSVKSSSRHQEVYFEKGQNILFRLNPESIDFINDIRLDEVSDETGGDACNVM